MSREESQVEAAEEATATTTTSSSSPEPDVEEKPLHQEEQAKSETSSQEDVLTKELSSPTNEDTEHCPPVEEDNEEIGQRQQQTDVTIGEQEATIDTGSMAATMEDEDKTRLKQELRQALELVEHLKSQIANMELERKGEQQQQPTEKPQLAGAWEKPAGGNNMSVEEGYPPQMVMTIASLVFVFTYLFF